MKGSKMTTALGLDYLTTEVSGRQAMIALTGDRSYAFVWHGGCYIDVYVRFQSHPGVGDALIDGEPYFIGEECVNVWDYSKGAPEIDWLDSVEFLYVINEWLGYR